MPIRINLLAEAQALEDLRRRDPVKRVILAGIISVILVLFWSSLLLFNTMITKSDLNRLEGDLYSRTNDNHQILESKNKLVEHKHKLNELHRLTTNRFLNGNLLEALQKNTVDNVQLMRLKVIRQHTRRKTEGRIGTFCGQDDEGVGKECQDNRKDRAHVGSKRYQPDWKRCQHHVSRQTLKRPLFSECVGNNK
jgi:hypothetical protein